MTATLTIHRTPTGYTYADTEHDTLYDAVRTVARDIWETRDDRDTTWLFVCLSDRGTAQFRGTKVEVRDADQPDPDGGIGMTDAEFDAFLKAAKS